MPEAGIDLAWERYLAAEKDRIRSVALACLRELIEAVHALPLAARTAWARERAREIVDHGADTPVRLPLFQEVLFPALLSGMRRSEPDCARWLAGLSQPLYKSAGCCDQLPESQRTEIGLLHAALTVDRADALARARLIRALSRRLEHALHELPDGVLHDRDGATIEQCGELRAELADFEALLIEHGAAAEYADLLTRCGYHFRAYPDYLARQQDFGSYADYLAEDGGPTGR